MSERNQYNVTAPTLADKAIVYEEQIDAAGNKKVTQVSALDSVNDGIRAYPDATYVNLTVSALIKTGSGRVQGVLVSSHTAGTLKLWDNTSAATTTIVNTMTFGTGERFIPLYGAAFGTGLFATIGGVADITVMYN